MAGQRLLITGGAGFIGSHLVHFLLRERPGVEIVNLDLLTYAGNLANLEGVRDDPRHTFVQGDVCDEALVPQLMDGVDAVLNLAAESHVDRSIRSMAPFVRTNIVGTRVLLDASLEAGVSRFVQVSTDEVYGELPELDSREGQAGPPPRFSEESPLRPRSPYSASKAAADLLALSFFATHGLDVAIARGSNNYGPRQHREKLIPLMATRALAGQPLPLYGDGLNVRDWIFVEDFCAGIVASLEEGAPGGVYNFGGNAERTNLAVVHRILEILGASKDLITFVPDRPGHDRRYAMDCRKAREALRWEPRAEFDEELSRTVAWYRDHPDHGSEP